MNRNLHSSSKLTEFARNFEAKPETLLNKVVNRLTSVYAGSSNADVAGSVAIVSENDNNATPQTEDTNQNQSVQVPSTSSKLANYRDTDLQQFWMPDSKSKECFECGLKFSTFKRKHHCRLCGQIFCSKCCSQILPGKNFGCTGDLKVCTYCSKRYTSSNDYSESQVNLEKIRKDVAKQPPNLGGYQEEEFISSSFNAESDSPANENEDIYQKIADHLPGELTGAALISFLVSKNIVAGEEDATVLLNHLILTGYIQSIDAYEPLLSDTSNVGNFPKRSIFKPTRKISTVSERSFDSMARGVSADVEDSGSAAYGPQSQRIYEELNANFKHNEKLLIESLLACEDLDQSWIDTLLHTVIHITKLLKPEKIWDIRSFVNLKKLPGGNRDDTQIISGVAFSKNVTHKDMTEPILNPRVLLLNCPIIYQREGKYINLEALKLQENEYLRNVVGRIQGLQPNILIVQKSVSGVAQDMLRSLGIILILDVKPSIISRISKCLQCDIVTSVDSNIGKPILGSCTRFEIMKFADSPGQKSKHIIVLKTDRNTRNCCVLLRGGSEEELTKVKRIARQILFARYNWRFEISLLVDEFAFHDGGPKDPSVADIANSLGVLSMQEKIRAPSELANEQSFECKQTESSPFNTLPSFLTTAISSGPDNKDYLTLLSQFRACNGVLKKKPKLNIVDRTKTKQASLSSDVKSVKNHGISFLFSCSYCNPHGASIICTQPRMRTMEFYGQTDCSLGNFLEQYCFRNTYSCTSCKFPMLNHVRRYVHQNGCIQVKLSSCENPDDNNDSIFVQSKCLKCDIICPKVQLSYETWYLSFGKYLESRFHNNFYVIHPNINNRSCSHSLHHDYVQMFIYKGIVASFSYTTIGILEQKFPSMVVALPADRKVPKSLSEEIKLFIPRGYDVYVKIYEKMNQILDESDCPPFVHILKSDQSAYGAQEEIVNALLMDDQANYYSVSDALFKLKKMLADSIECWANRFNEYLDQRRSLCNSKQEQVPPQPDIRSNSQSEESGNSNAQEKDGKIAGATDKKKLLTLIKEIFPSDKSMQYILQSPILPSEHYCLPTGELPVIVNDQDFSSIISYALVTEDYRQYINATVCEDQYSRAYDSQTSLSDDKEADKEKKKPQNNFIDIQFRDSNFGIGITNFSCRVYFPREFDDMRTTFLRSGSNGDFGTKSSRCMFARSLCKSIRWDARGGKSGSKFSKTIDDRFILKEMSKQELTIFENFGPQYFQYINSCHFSSQITLLAKIFGVFKISVKKENSHDIKYLLVMENLFYSCEISKKFDLKGVKRNRLVDPNSQTGERVLQDGNLEQMSWSDPLYITMESKSILMEAIRRDATFLQTNEVMDYSMLVGQCDEKKTLFLGIIDYIRTYTFDKKIESIMKQSVLHELPTIINPKHYKERFSTAMEGYFFAVPDRHCTAIAEFGE